MAVMEAVEEKQGQMSRMRSLLAKAVTEGLTPSERIYLKGDIARLNERIAKVNDRIGGEVATVSPYVKIARDVNASAQLVVS